MRWAWHKLYQVWASGDPLVRSGQFAQVLRQVALISIALLLPRLNVTKTEIGYWEQYQYLAYFLGFAWLTGIGQAYLQKVRGLSDEDAEQLTARLLRLIISLSLVFCLLLLLAQKPILAALAGDGKLPGWSLYLGFLLTHWPALMYEQVLLAQKRSRRLLWFSLVSNLGLLLAVVLPLSLDLDWATALRFLLPLSGCKAMFMLADNGWTLFPRKASKGALQIGLMKAAWPLIAYAGLGATIVSFDPWLVNFWFQDDQATFAIYRYGTRELPLIVAVTNGIGAAVLPQFAENRTAALAQLRASSLRLMHLFFPFAAILMVSSIWWWEWLFTTQFAASLPLFQLFLFVGVSRFIMSITPITGTGHGKALIGVGLVELILNAILSFWLVSKLGLIGIVWATIIAYTLDRLIAAAYLYRKEGIALSAYCHWRWLLGYTLLLGLVYWGLGL